MLASGAHISIGGLELMLDFDPDNPQDTPYRHRFEPLPVPGEPEDLRQDVLVWNRSDWVGGEGDKFHDPSDPVLYYKGTNLNTRTSGQATHRPTLVIVTVV
jgi:hypothetical protein